MQHQLFRRFRFMFSLFVLGFALHFGQLQFAQAQLPAGVLKLAQERGLTPDDIKAALATYTPTGKYDEYVMFASGGHSGQVIAIGMPSMRLLKVIAVFTPDPWQGYGYGVKDSPVDTANINGKPMGGYTSPRAE